MCKLALHHLVGLVAVTYRLLSAQALRPDPCASLPKAYIKGNPFPFQNHVLSSN